jgi:hypothetical protein
MAPRETVNRAVCFEYEMTSERLVPAKFAVPCQGS